MSMRLDDEELELLAGHGASRLSHAAKLAYMLGIRPYMDYETGLVGYSRRVSYQSLRELLEFAPPRGSRRPEQTYSRDKLQTILEELERAGLIRWIKNDARGLFFECLAAHRDIPSEMRNTPRTPPMTPPRTPPGKPSNYGGSEGMCRVDDQGVLIAMSTPPPVSGNTNTDHLTRGRAREPVDNSVAGMPACVPVAEWVVYEQERNQATGRPMSIGRKLALWQELAALDAEGYDLGKVLRRCVAHGFATFDRRPELMKKPPGATNQTPGAVTSTAKPTRGHYADDRDIDNSAVARTRRACDQWRREQERDAGEDASGVVLHGSFERVAF